jgi:hydroxymethylglutaryl-CoA lyase
MGPIMHLEDNIFIEENSPRDGIQNERALFTFEERVELIDALSRCGFRRIQIGSFVDPRRIPQMAFTEQVCERINRVPGVVYSALVLNRKGLERALGCGIGHISFFISASETHSLRNNNCSIAESISRAEGMIEMAKSCNVPVQAGIMNAFGCAIEGFVPMGKVVDLVGLLIEKGADEINLADTPGTAHPLLIEERVNKVLEHCTAPLALHLHNSNGLGLINLYAAWKAGVRRFDSCCGGLGGCPFVPGAAGNVATEDLVHLFDSMGIHTGISKEGLIEVLEWFEVKLGRSLKSSECCS